jgi:hypothetical protein
MPLTPASAAPETPAKPPAPNQTPAPVSPLVPVKPSAASVPPAPGGQLSAPKKIKPPAGINARNCTIVGIVFALLAFTGTAYLISELGLMRVPFFSRFYEGPKPLRLIQPKTLGWEDFQKSLTDRIYVQYEQEGATYGIQLTEQDLTDLLSTVIEGAVRDKSWRVKISQIAVAPDRIELLMKIEWGWFGKLDFLISFKPVVDDKNAVHFETTSAQIGDFRIPPDWGMYIGSYLFNRDLGTWEIRIGNRSVIRSVTLQDGIIDMVLNR